MSQPTVMSFSNGTKNYGSYNNSTNDPWQAVHNGPFAVNEWEISPKDGFTSNEDGKTLGGLYGDPEIFAIDTAEIEGIDKINQDVIAAFRQTIAPKIKNYGDLTRIEGDSKNPYSDSYRQKAILLKRETQEFIGKILDRSPNPGQTLIALQNEISTNPELLRQLGGNKDYLSKVFKSLVNGIPKDIKVYKRNSAGQPLLKNGEKAVAEEDLTRYEADEYEELNLKDENNNIIVDFTSEDEARYLRNADLLKALKKQVTIENRELTNEYSALITSDEDEGKFTGVDLGSATAIMATLGISTKIAQRLGEKGTMELADNVLSFAKTQGLLKAKDIGMDSLDLGKMSPQQKQKALSLLKESGVLKDIVTDAKFKLAGSNDPKFSTERRTLSKKVSNAKVDEKAVKKVLSWDANKFARVSQGKKASTVGKWFSKGLLKFGTKLSFGAARRALTWGLGWTNPIGWALMAFEVATLAYGAYELISSQTEKIQEEGGVAKSDTFLAKAARFHDSINPFRAMRWT